MTSGDPPWLLRKATRTFPSGTAQIPLARVFVQETVAGWGDQVDDQRMRDLVLMASELFTNAILHGVGDVEVSVGLTPLSVRLTVSDQGTHELSRTLPPPQVEGVSGRGLRIVDRLASAWGSGRDHRGGTLVWLEVPRP
jgi:anti-sigma regulatory factor (Ser/Thr protein kinase)